MSEQPINLAVTTTRVTDNYWIVNIIGADWMGNVHVNLEVKQVDKDLLTTNEWIDDKINDIITNFNVKNLFRETWRGEVTGYRVAENGAKEIILAKQESHGVSKIIMDFKKKVNDISGETE